MTITICLPPELEKQLRERAVAAGVAAEDLVLNALAEQFGQPGLSPPISLSREESDLLREINQGLPETSWRRYHELVAARRAQTLTQAEHTELIALTDEIELAHSRRMERLNQLARLRGIGLDELMNELGIRDPGYA